MTSIKEEEANVDMKNDSTTTTYTLSSTISNKHRISITCLILLSHALFLWGQLDILWGQFVYTQVNVQASATNNITQTISGELFNGQTSTTKNKDDAVEIGSWSYGGMLSELWIYSKLTAVFLFVFSAFWPHLKLVLLHVYFYLPVPSKPRQAAMYWLDSVGKMSLADVCATCMLFLLLNIQADINLGALANQATQLMNDVVVSGDAASILPVGLSNATQSILNKGEDLVYDELVKLSDSIFENDDPKVYKSFLEKGCSTFYNDGNTCLETTFYEPSTVKGGIAGIMTKCLRIRGDKCSQCECIVNNVIYNKAIPSGIVESKVDSAMSLVFAKLLSAVTSGNINSWFDVEGGASVGMYITIYPAFLGFTFAVIFSIIASLVVSDVDDKHNRKMYLNAESTSEALANGGVEDQRSLLFCSDGSRNSRLARIISIIVGVGIIPLTFFAIYVKMFVYSIAGLFEEIITFQNEATETFYSVIDCVTTVNDGTAYGKTFSVFYGLFLLGIPLLRATILAIVSLIPMSPLWHVRLAHVSNNVGSFLGWEPFFICVLIVMAELPNLTKDIISPEQCEAIEENNIISYFISRFGLDTSTCFVMYFDLLPHVSVFIIAWAFLTGLNSLVWKKVLQRYDPFGSRAHGDEGGPYCGCRQCCYFGCASAKRQEHQEEEESHDSKKLRK